MKTTSSPSDWEKSFRAKTHANLAAFFGVSEKEIEPKLIQPNKKRVWCEFSLKEYGFFYLFLSAEK